MSDIIRLLICDDDPGYRDYLRAGFNGHHRLRVAYLASSGKDAIEKSKDGAPDAVLIDQSLLDMDGMDAAQQIARVSPGTVIFLLSDSPWAGLVQQAVTLGIRDVFDKRLSPQELSEQIEKWVDQAREDMSRRRLNLPEYASGRGPEGKEAVWQETQAVAVRQLVIAVTSGTKGGVGKTTVSTNMACAAACLSNAGKISVALVDFNESGNVHIQLNLGEAEALAPKSVVAWEYMPENPTREDIDECLLLHKASGLLVIPGVPSVAKSTVITEELVKKIINILRKRCTVVICDVPPSFMPEATLSTIEAADKVVVVTKPDVQDIRDAVELYRLVYDLPTTEVEKLHAVVNRAGDPCLITPAEFESKVQELLPLPFIGRLPYDPGVSHGVMRGCPYVLTHPDGSYTQAIKQVINYFSPLFIDRPMKVQEQKKGGLFGIFKK